MAEHANGIATRLRHLLTQADTTPDGELLARFVDDRDGEAFAHIVRRHGPMVHGVCRRVLRNDADADDAFQATFLVLARRASSVRPRPLLGNWLYGVAYRTALEARRAAAVRRLKERRAAVMKTDATAEDRADDLREILDRELAALPDVYRAAVILCDLQGLSRKDAALRLGWCEGTLSGRLSRARSMLAARLSRHGLALPAAGLGVLTGTASAGVPVELVESTARIGFLLSAGEAAVASAPVVTITEGVMKAMLLTKLKGVATALVVGCAVLATAVVGWQANASGAGEGVAPGQVNRKPAPNPDKERIAELERERDKLLREVLDLRERLTKLENTKEREERERLRESALEAKARADERKAQFKKLQDELDKALVEGAKDRAQILVDKLAEQKRLLEREEADRARATDPTKGKSDAEKALERKLEEERARATVKPSGKGDRVSELEDRVKQLEAALQKLLADSERPRKR